MLWLYRITIDSVYERDRSERAMGAAAAERSVFAYTTERRVHSPAEWQRSWEPAGRLLVHIDRGVSEGEVLVRLPKPRQQLQPHRVRQRAQRAYQALVRFGHPDILATFRTTSM